MKCGGVFIAVRLMARSSHYSLVSSAPHWLQQHRLAGLPVSHHLMLLLNYMDDKGHFTPGWVFLFLTPQVAAFSKGRSHLIF